MHLSNIIKSYAFDGCNYILDEMPRLVDFWREGNILKAVAMAVLSYTLDQSRMLSSSIRGILRGP